jgi:HEPN domain-containing protein
MSDEAEFDVEGQVEYWRGLAMKDLMMAERILTRDAEPLYALFFVHLALEKIMKSLVVKRTKNFPPKDHRLLFLAEIANIELSQEQSDFCAKITAYNIEARYPGVLVPPPALEKATEYLAYAKELIQWLTAQL